MIPWSEIDRATVPGGGEMRLVRRGGEYSIVLGGIELMNSRRGGSEEALATLSCARIERRAGPTLLIGGLGMGFTLRAALARLGPDARVVVAELVPAVIEWARGPLSDLFEGSLADSRVTVHEGDVGDVIRSRPAVFDAILLDVDNGPDGLTRPGNDDLYGLGGLAAARAALRPGGVLSVWSTGPDKAFAGRLVRAGFDVDEVGVRAKAGRGARHVIWFATRPGGGIGPRGRSGRRA